MRSDLVGPADRLRRLPGDAHAPYGWTEFQRRAELRRQHPVARGSKSTRRYAALAACLVVAVAATAFWARWSSHDDAANVADVQASPPIPRPAAPAARLEPLEQWLASLPEEPVVVRVGTRIAVTDLEDRIAWVDDLLTLERVEGAHAARVKTLERERARLITSLAQVRYAETLAAEMP